jgi:hypothetical protein
MREDLAGYVLERPARRASGPASMWVWVVLRTVSVTGSVPDASRTVRLSPGGKRTSRLQLRPVGRLTTAGQLTAEAPPALRVLRPVRSGRAYRVSSRPARCLVAPELATALEAVFEGFAQVRGFTPEKPLEIRFSRGFEASSPGHRKGRAADVDTVAGKSLLEWKLSWDDAMAAAEALADPARRAEAISAEQKRNLGYGLYKALQEHGGWLVDPAGWRPYRGAMQLFGPWTAIEGPWTTMRIKHPTPYQRQRLADQQWVFQAHHDHIHVAR